MTRVHDLVRSVGADLDDRSIHVYYFDCDLPTSPACLDDDEKARCRRLVTPALRTRFTNCHSTVRTILAAYTERRAEDVRYRFARFGKPFLEHDAIRFNLSHSAQLAMLAVARVEVGIDCEALNPQLDYEDLRGQIDECPANITSPEIFFRIWTRKEAVLKLLGCGFQIPPQRAQVPATAEFLGDWSVARVGVSDHCQVLDCRAPQGFFSAVAATAPCAVREFRIDPVSTAPVD